MNVFISYSHVDSEIVTKICQFFDSASIDYFHDAKDVIWGGHLVDAVKNGINTATHLLLILSPASLKSAWVPYETGQAKNRGLKILPYLTHPALDIPSYLSGIKHISSFDQLKSFFERSGEHSLSDEDKDLLFILRYLQEVGVNDPEVDVFVATMENDLDKVKEACSRGGTGMVSSGELLQRHKEFIRKSGGAVAAGIRSGLLTISRKGG